MNALVGHSAQLGWVALKAVLLFLTAALGLRLSERRTIAQLSIFDFVVAVATGAIVGRTATSSTTSFLTGAAALLALLVVHRIAAAMQQRGWLGNLLERRPLVICADGHLRDEALTRAGISEREALRMLRKAGVGDPDDVRYVLFEQRGAVTVVPHGPLGRAHLAALRESGMTVDPSAEPTEDHRGSERSNRPAAAAKPQRTEG